jgi:hypothetical protein
METIRHTYRYADQWIEKNGVTFWNPTTMECWCIDRVGKIPVRYFVAAVGIAAVAKNSARSDVGGVTGLDAGDRNYKLYV